MLYCDDQLFILIIIVTYTRLLTCLCLRHQVINPNPSPAQTILCKIGFLKKLMDLSMQFRVNSKKSCAQRTYLSPRR